MAKFIVILVIAFAATALAFPAVDSDRHIRVVRAALAGPTPWFPFGKYRPFLSWPSYGSSYANAQASANSYGGGFYPFGGSNAYAHASAGSFGGGLYPYGGSNAHAHATAYAGSFGRK